VLGEWTPSLDVLGSAPVHVGDTNVEGLEIGFENSSTSRGLVKGQSRRRGHRVGAGGLVAVVKNRLSVIRMWRWRSFAAGVSFMRMQTPRRRQRPPAPHKLRGIGLPSGVRRATPVSSANSETWSWFSVQKAVWSKVQFDEIIPARSRWIRQFSLLCEAFRRANTGCSRLKISIPIRVAIRSFSSESRRRRASGYGRFLL
jgi:hypothetical protein